MKSHRQKEKRAVFYRSIGFKPYAAIKNEKRKGVFIGKHISFYLICFLCLFSACENFWNLPPLEPCTDATSCQVAANEPRLTELSNTRIFHKTILFNDSLGMDKILVSGGTLQPNFGQFFNIDGTALADTGQVPREPFSVRQFAFNAIAADLTSKKNFALGGIQGDLSLMHLDMPFDWTSIDASEISDRLSIYNGNNNEWTADKVEIPRAGHTATWLFNSSQILLIGGNPNDNRVELYHPTNFSSSISASLQVNRAFHTATFFDGNQVLIVGGIAFDTQQTTDAIEVYNVTSNSLESKNVGDKFTPRVGHTVNRIGNKGVVIIGGQNGFDFHNEILIYDLENPVRNVPNTFLSTSIAYHTATNLPNGWILIAGGKNLFDTQSELTLFNPESEGLLTLDCSLTFPRYGHSTTLVESENLSEVKLLVIGGRNENEAVLQSEMITLNLNCIEF